MHYSEVKKVKNLPIPESVITLIKYEEHVVQAPVSIRDDILDRIST